MRKVYKPESSSTGLLFSIVFSVGLTAALFATMPFIHRVATPESSLELVKGKVIEVPPEIEEELPPPPPEEEKPEEAPPPPELIETAMEIPVSADLEVVLGAGGGLDGFGETDAQEIVKSVMAEETFDVGKLQKRPEAISQVPPDYPAELKKAKVEGAVTLVFILNEQGRVEDPRVENSTRPEFEKPALEAIRRWRFRPGEKDGEPVRTYVRQAIRFRVPSG